MGRTRISPVEVTTARYRAYPRIIDDLLPAAFHDTEAHANNPIETDPGRLKARLRPMRGLKRDRTARVIVTAHAFVQNLRRGFYDLGTEVPPAARLAQAFDELAPRHLTPAREDRFTPALASDMQQCPPSLLGNVYPAIIDLCRRDLNASRLGGRSRSRRVTSKPHPLRCRPNSRPVTPTPVSTRALRPSPRLEDSLPIGGCTIDPRR
jgi:hypothetical protein